MSFAAAQLIWIALMLGAEPGAPDAGSLIPAPERFKSAVDDPLLAPAPRARDEVKSWEEALARLRQNSTDERSAEAGVERAQGRSRQALAVLMPNLRLTVSGLYDVLNPSVPPLAAAGAGSSVAAVGGKSPTIPLATASVGLSQSLVDVGGWRGLSSAQAAERGSDANLRDVRRRVIQGLGRSLVAVVAAERVAELNRLGLRQALERAALTVRTRELGAATQLDVVRIQQDVEIARGALVAGDEQLLRTREALGLALGVGAEVGVPKSFSLSGLADQARRQCGELDWRMRSDLEAARATVESARDSRQQASAGYFPTLGLTSGLLGYSTNPGLGRLASWNVAAVLTVPIWEGGARGGLVQERRGAEVQAVETLESTRRTVALEVGRSRRGVAVSEALVSSAGRARDLAAEMDALTQRSFEVGRGSSLELVQSAAALRQADVTLATREFELVQARLDSILTEAQCDW